MIKKNKNDSLLLFVLSLWGYKHSRTTWSECSESHPGLIIPWLGVLETGTGTGSVSLEWPEVPGSGKYGHLADIQVCYKLHILQAMNSTC